METSLGLLLVKIFKTVLCARTHRAGRFNVHQANLSNVNVEKINGIIIHKNTDLVINTQQTSEMGTCCRSPLERRSSPTGSITSTQSQSQLTPSRQLSDGERLKKVILELIDTERTYVKHLNNLLENYLEPLRNAPFLSSAEVSALFGNIREIVAFQRLFLQALTEAIEMEPGFTKFDHPYEFKNVLFSIGSAFLYYATQFKLYSSFCASHSKAQKVLHPSEGNQALQEFLMSRNPRQQHSATLESYLIKPIQRILKYPLLLQQLKALTEPGSDEHRHLLEALKVMEKVAEHINEMQRIHEEYGAIFDHLFRQHQKSCKQAIDLSPGDLLYYGGVEWLNISDFLGKIKKGLELHAMCFVFKTAVVFLCKERLRQKKKLMGGSGKNSSSEVEIIRYQVLIPVTEVQVRASSMKDMDNHFLWELIHLKSQVQRRSEKVYHLSNSTSEFRNAFLKTIRQIIRESVRNMNIPPNKPSSGSSGTGGSGGGMGGGSGIGGGRINTNTLQPSRSAGGKKRHPQTQTGSLQRHSGSKYDYDTLESYDNVPETQPHHYQQQSKGQQQPQPQQPQPPPPPPPQQQQKQQPQYSQQTQQQQQKQLISQLQQHQKKQAHEHQSQQLPQHYQSEQQQQQLPQPNSHQQQNNQQHPLQQQSNSGSFDSDQQQGSLRTRSKTMSDAMDELSDSTTKSDGGREDFGTRSEGEEESSERKRISLGRTPNHLSLSTTSTLSTGSTGSQARLIQASNQPSNYQPVKSLGSPIWKPRENFGSTQSGKSALGSSSTSLSRCGKTRNGRSSESNSGNGPGGIGNENERIRLPKTNPPPFTYLPPSTSFSLPLPTSVLPKSHSTLDLQRPDDEYKLMVRNKDSSSFSGKGNSKREKYVYNRTTLYEETLQSNFTNDYILKREFVREGYLPHMCSVKTIDKGSLSEDAETSHCLSKLSQYGNYLKSVDGESSVSNATSTESCDSSVCKAYFASSSKYSRTRDPLFASSLGISSSSSSCSSYSSPPPFHTSSTFVKQGLSFKLIDSSLIDSSSSLDSSSPVLRKPKVDDSSRHLHRIEDTFNKLSASLTERDTPHVRGDNTKSLDKNFYFDDILGKLEEMKKNNFKIKNELSRSTLDKNFEFSDLFGSSQPPKPPTRSSSYIERFSVDQTPYFDTKRFTDFETLNLFPLEKENITNDEGKFTASIEVLNKTAQTIDSLVNQLKKF